MSFPAQTLSNMQSFEDQIATAVVAHGLFPTEKPIYVSRAPGRLDVMGGNVDYTGGNVLQGLLREAIWVAAQARTDEAIRIVNPGAEQFGWNTEFEAQMSDLCDVESVRALCQSQPGSLWVCYVLGALYFLKNLRGCGEAGGVDLFLASDLPPNKGVSSSAALGIATLKAASAAWGVTLEGTDLATAGQWVENVVVGAACGIMDQAAIVLGREGYLLPMLCQPCQPSPLVTLPAGVRIIGIDSMAARSTTSTAYETARAAAFMGYKLICQREGIEITPEQGAEIPRWTEERWHGHLSNLAPSEFRARYERLLPKSIKGSEFLASTGEHVDPFTRVDPETQYPVRAAVRYATEENLRVQTVRTLLEAMAFGRMENALPLLGEILCQSHVAYSECGLGNEACDDLVRRVLTHGLAGAKMTGGGGGGVVAIVCRSEDEHSVRAIAEAYGKERGAMPHIFEGSSDGVDAFGVRVLQPAPLRRRQ
ncbi:galactokinase family protein [Granulicella sp. dw_53]|uniref:GHMP family kinase ATP-binding protein n=1 Tax=Granulicella sp. dw_53 TaxID=2719792 RepID=UPI002106E4FC|nr:galactokinase family protein [Granulicella sp. dw_53]